MKFYLTVISDFGEPKIVEIGKHNLKEVTNLIEEELETDGASKDIMNDPHLSGRIRQVLMVTEEMLRRMLEAEIRSEYDSELMVRISSASSKMVADRLGVDIVTVKGKLGRELKLGTIENYRKLVFKVYSSYGEDGELFDVIRKGATRYSADTDLKAVDYMEKKIRDMLNR